MKTSLVRLNKFLADAGVASRRKADELIQEGLVKVNGITVDELGKKVNPNADSVKVRGKLVKVESTKRYFILNKPTGVLTSTSDPEDRPLVMGYFKQYKERLFPVGRLDWDSEGMLLITNDGDFAQEINHPSKKIPKTYLVKLNTEPSDAKLQKLVNGVTIVGGRVSAEYVEKIKRGSDKYPWIKIIVTEGKNRQIRKMFEKIGCDVKKLQRVAIGQLTMGSLAKGKVKELTTVQLMKIFKKYVDKDELHEKKKVRRLQKSVKKQAPMKSKKDYFKKVSKGKTK